MSELRRVLAWCYAIVALTTMWFAVWFGQKNGSLAESSNLSPIKKAILVAAVPAVFAIIALVYGAASWTVLKRKPSGRNWGIAASLLLCLTGIGMSYRQPRVSIILVVGITGLVAFSRRITDPVETFRNQRCPIPGDGTNRIFNKSVGVVLCVAWYLGMTTWYRWANSRSLHSPDNILIYLIEILLMLMLAVAVHELGHAAAGMALGMKLQAFLVGPLRWRIFDGKWKFQFLPKAFLSLGGATGVVPVNPMQSPGKKICMIAAGPLTSLCTGLVALCATITAPGHTWEPAWHLLALFNTISLVAGVVNLVPFQTPTSYSDGAQIYQILSGGPWADYHRAIAIAGSSQVTSLRPRDYDIEAIHRAAGRISQGLRGLHLPILASTYYLDHGRYPEALHELNKAEAIYGESVRDIPVGLHFEFIFGKAILQRDAAGARLWWERMEAKKPDQNWDYWRSRSALLWIEGCPEDASEAWNTGNRLVQQLPCVGANEFHKDMFLVLRQALDGVSTVDSASQHLDAVSADGTG